MVPFPFIPSWSKVVFSMWQSEQEVPSMGPRTQTVLYALCALPQGPVYRSEVVDSLRARMCCRLCLALKAYLWQVLNTHLGQSLNGQRSRFWGVTDRNGGKEASNFKRNSTHLSAHRRLRSKVRATVQTVLGQHLEGNRMEGRGR